MNIQYIRLENDVCQTLNDLAQEARRTVSDLVNDILRKYLQERSEPSLPASRTEK
jgi:predicted DNA-binding protein